MILAPEDHAAGRAQTHWTDEQREHLARCVRERATIAYWCSDAHGRPANHSFDPIAARSWTARPGLIQSVKGPLKACSGHALHATHEPHRWSGSRVWIVALVGEIEEENGKIASLTREIIGAILPEEALDPRVGVRIGRRDLYGANLYGANLSRADLYGANLSGALRASDPPVGWCINNKCLVQA